MYSGLFRNGLTFGDKLLLEPLQLPDRPLYVDEIVRRTRRYSYQAYRDEDSG